MLGSLCLGKARDLARQVAGLRTPRHGVLLQQQRDDLDEPETLGDAREPILLEELVDDVLLELEDGAAFTRGPHVRQRRLGDEILEALWILRPWTVIRLLGIRRREIHYLAAHRPEK